VGDQGGLRVLAVYRLKGDALTICGNQGEGTRPITLRPADDSGHERTTFRRLEKR
jgi:hypothetical protein